MPRVKKGTIRNKSRKTTLKAVKGYRQGRSSKKKLATEAIKHAGRNAMRERKILK
jgi:ribosomal protein L20